MEKVHLGIHYVISIYLSALHDHIAYLSSREMHYYLSVENTVVDGVR